jgi:hypothetical protein
MTAQTFGTATPTWGSLRRRDMQSAASPAPYARGEFGCSAPAVLPWNTRVGQVFTASDAGLAARAISVFSLGELQISVAPEDDQWVAVEYLTSMFGEGDHPAAAVDDLIRSLRELHDDLEAHVGRMVPAFERQLDALRRSFPHDVR